MEVKTAIKNLMNYSLDDNSRDYYIGFIQGKIKETNSLRGELKEKGLSLSEVSKELYDEYMDCIACLRFRGKKDNLNYLN